MKYKTTKWTIEKIIATYKRKRDKLEDIHLPSVCLEWSQRKAPQLRVDELDYYAKVSRIILSYKLGRPIRNGYFACHTCDNPRCVKEEHLWEGTPKDNSQDMAQKGRSATGERHGSRTKPHRVARGDRHGSRTQPHRVARGDRNGSRLHPERLPRGENHWSKLHPECKATGERHWSYRHPEKVKQGEEKPNAIRFSEGDIRTIKERYARGGITQYELADEYSVSQSYIRDIIHDRHWSLRDR